jgi:hypothetical protein
MSEFLHVDDLVRGGVYLCDARGGYNRVGVYLGNRRFLFRHIDFGTECLDFEFIAEGVSGTVFPRKCMGEVPSGVTLPPETGKMVWDFDPMLEHFVFEVQKRISR